MLGYRWIFFLILSFTLLTGRAADLMEVYQHALKSDPSFKRAEADWLSAKELYPLALSGQGIVGSGVFPNISASASYGYNFHQTRLPSGTNHSEFGAQDYGVSVTQPLFNLSSWQAIHASSYAVKAATATYWAAQQDLIARVATAYFEVQRAQETLNFVLAQQKAFLRQYNSASRKFKVGLVAVTDVYDAKARYDSARAEVIGNRNALANKMENLRAITGVAYRHLKGLGQRIPLATPAPDNVLRWVSLAEQQNYTIKAQENTMLAARASIKEAKLARSPTVNALARYDYSTNNTSRFASGDEGKLTQSNSQVGLQLVLPIFQGGFISANTQQKRYEYLSASDQLELTRRGVINKVRQAFLGVKSNISKIYAERQAVISARKQLSATQAGFSVGTRTMLDVLDNLTNLTQAQQKYASARYDYIENIIALKQQAGTLSPKDLRFINSWLIRDIDFSHQLGSGTALHHPLNRTFRVMYTENKPRASQLASAYTIQLYASVDLSHINTLVKQLGRIPLKPLYIRHVDRAGQRWYRLFYGSFADYKQAKQAIASLPDRVVRQLSPFVAKR